MNTLNEIIEKRVLLILEEERKKAARKKTYDKIMEEIKDKPPIDIKVLYKEVQDLIKLLESDVI